MNKKIVLSFALFCVAFRTGFTQTEVTQVDWFNNASTLFRNGAGVALSQGVASANSDGMLVQLGYFSAATTANNFAGTWIPITGFGAAPRTTIGDSPDLSGAGDGRIGFSTVFRNTSNAVQVFEPALGDTGSYFSQSSITITTTTPPSGAILSIRFYDTSSGTTGAYNTVSSDDLAWRWVPPTDAGSNVLLNLVSANSAGTLEFQDAANPFRTTILIPEPSTYALLVLGALGLGVMHRRRARTVA